MTAQFKSDAKPSNAHSAEANQAKYYSRAPATAAHGKVVEPYRHAIACTKCNALSNALRPGSRHG